MKRGLLVVLFLIACFILSGRAYSADQMPADAEKDSYMMKLEARYQKAVALKENGEYEASLAVLQKLVDENQGVAKYEIARLDAILEQSRDMKETGNTAWKSKAKEAAYKIKTIMTANAGNGDFWVVYAKYSWLIEANKETHVTKAIQKAFYYKPDNPEAYIVQADYNFDKARDAQDDKQNSMMQGIGNVVSNKFSIGQAAKSSYEAALQGKLSDARKAYIYYKLGNLEERIFQVQDDAKKNWERAVSLSPDGRSGKLAKQRLGI